MVDCFRKEVIFQTPDGREAYFLGEHHVLSSYVISALISSKLLRKGCKAYLACMVNTEASKSNLVDILVVCEFLDVSSEKLPRFLPDREIEFGIDLILKIRSISRAPYRMALAELR